MKKRRTKREPRLEGAHKGDAQERRYRKKPEPRNRDVRVVYWFLYFLTRNFRPFSVQ